MKHVLLKGLNLKKKIQNERHSNAKRGEIRKAWLNLAAHEKRKTKRTKHTKAHKPDQTHSHDIVPTADGRQTKGKRERKRDGSEST